MISADDGISLDSTIVTPSEALSPSQPLDQMRWSKQASELDIEPLDATFRDHTAAPLHSWFPYLEGYSPRFVRRVRSAYLPTAERVLEPFAGSGTTPIVLGQDGVECGYAEANPAMALVSRSKLNALLPSTNQKKLAADLSALAMGLDDRIGAACPNQRINASYQPAFGASTYFLPEALDQVLRIRTVGDEIQEAGCQLLSDCFDVAVMSSLLPTSLLKRAGDVRFRTEKELRASLPEPKEEVKRTLLRMAAELLHAEPMRASARFIGSDARNLSFNGAGDTYDGVITSPPYLNGTNYIRNARLELWYLGHLSTKSHLRALRDCVVTSGINDVDANTRYSPVSRRVEQVMHRLRESSYDDRIEKMVGGYFVDMQLVLVAIKQRLAPRAVVCIDIGDSIYGGVHVPTDELLCDIAQELGFVVKDRVYLRKRKSKGGSELRQTLLVFANAAQG